jgi:cell division protein ZapA (FtsZ GTPase activity inhibitor)
MEKISLRITIAGRTYPINVLESEKEKVLKAADDINKAIELLSKSYAVKDPLDLLAMSSLQLLTKAQSVPPVQLPPDYSGIEHELEVFVDSIKKLDE